MDLSNNNSEFYIHTPSLLAKNTFFYAQHIGFGTFESSYVIKRRNFSSILLTCTINGKGILHYKGKHYEIGKNQVMLINCKEPHEYHTQEGTTWEQSWLHFYGSGSEEYFSMIFSNFGPVINVLEPDTLNELLQDLLNLKKNSDTFFEVKSSALIIQILTELILNSHKYNKKIKGLDEVYNQIETSIQYIKQNYKQPISVEDLAKAACLSISHFSRRFKDYTGYSPYEYLIKHRITESKLLLRNLEYPIDHISQMVGFEYHNNFVRSFRSIEGIAPSTYRKLFLASSTENSE